MFKNCCGCKKNDSKIRIRGDVEAKNGNHRKSELPILDPIRGGDVSAKPKRVSIVSDVKIEISDNDDDVFCEGVGPPIKLAENLGTPDQKYQLPRWFSEEEDEEREFGGVQEPPATPVGKDELALKRHRLFSELLHAAQHVNEHRVRFDPLGPKIAADLKYLRLTLPSAMEEEFFQYLGELTAKDVTLHALDYLVCVWVSTEYPELESVISRLEDITTRLESLYVANQHLANTSSDRKAIKMSVQGFTDVLQGPFAQYLAISKQIGGDVSTHSDIVNQAFQAQLNYLTVVSQSKQPSSQNDQIALLKPTSEHITSIQEFREKNRTSPYFNHLSAVSESIPALGWVTVSPAPAPYIKEMNDAGQFYTNRVLKDWKEKDKKHVDWVKAWIQTLTELQAFVKQYHTTGLVWGGKSAPVIAGGCPPPPPPGCPPPPPSLADLPPITDDPNADRSALFAQINQGENITKGLKKVTADMQTHKNPTLRQGPAPFKTPAGSMQAKPQGALIDKPPSFTRDGKKWVIEYQKGNHDLLVENAEMNNVVYVFRCTESTIIVKGKLNSIVMDSCKKTSVVFDSLVSSMEFINCQSVQMQVLEKVPTISVDKTDGCQMYLSPQSLDVEIISSKSSEMNVLVPKGQGDYAEYPVPEQFKTTVIPSGNGLKTIIVESKG